MTDDQKEAGQYEVTEGPHACPDEVDRLLRVVRDLALELHPQRRDRNFTDLDSTLDRDLGFDSLGRAELLLRLERAFKVDLPETLLSEADRLRDLLEAILHAKTGVRLTSAATQRYGTLEVVAAAPATATSLTEVLDWHVAQHPDRPQVILWGEQDADATITYRDLAESARAAAGALRELGLAPGERAAIMLPTGAAFFRAFFAVLYAGGIPVPIYPPMRLSQLEDHLRRQAGILRNSGAGVLITVPEAVAVATLLKAQVLSLRRVLSFEELQSSATQLLPRTLRADSTALIQYTSGSTGDPKGVVLSHANLLANIRAMGEAMEASSADVFVSWLPLYHDMGLIGAWLGSLYFAAPVVIMSPLAFLARPERWLWAIHRYRGTLSAAPNFGFEFCLRKVRDEDIEGLDLSSLRMVVNGAEPVSPQTIERFSRRFARHGFRPEALAPVYGLAEASVGLAFPPPGRLSIVDRVERDALAKYGEARPAPAGDPNSLEFVACGRPLPGHEVRIVDETGREVGERHEGRLEFRGPSTTRGYFQNEAKTRDLFRDDWLDSGDRAYIAAGDIFVTGRIKDIIIRAGRNIYPHEVEEEVGEIDGVRKGCVAVFGSPDPVSGTERIIILAETRETGESARGRLRQRIEEIGESLLETPADDVVLVPPRTVPKTSSGKIRRAAARELYESKRWDTPTRALWWQIVRLTVAGAAPQLRRVITATAALCYAAYWWAVICLIGGGVWLLVNLLPGRRARWALVHAGARLVLRMQGIALTVQGRPNLPARGGILVANHASYLAGLVLSAAIPGELVFLAKKELEPQFFAGRLLKRLGVLFVDRFEPERSAEDIADAVGAARADRRLMVFAEGTLTRMPGLLDFHLGAFVVAAVAQQPVIPVAIRGTRSILRGGQWFPRHGAVELSIERAQLPKGDDFSSAVYLRDAVRAIILDRVGEPDLA